MRYNTISNDVMLRRRITQSSIMIGNVFFEDELARIVDLCSSIDVCEATIANDHVDVDKDIRESKINFFSRDLDNAWIFERFNQLIYNINEEFYGFDLYGYNTIQYTVYEGETLGKYDWHSDLLYGKELGQTLHSSITRKMSVVMLLNEPDKDFTGGEFQINLGRESDAITIDMKRGDVLLFPSFVLHRVKPVLSGVRKSIVIWVEGPKFR